MQSVRRNYTYASLAYNGADAQLSVSLPDAETAVEVTLADSSRKWVLGVLVNEVMMGGLERFATDGEWSVAYRDVALMIIRNSTAESVDRLARIFLATYHGVEYSQDGGVVVPALPDAPVFDAAYSLPSNALRRELWDITGSTPAGWFGLGGERVTLASILQALRAGDEGEVDKWIEKVDLLNDASEVSGIWSAVKGTFADLAEVAEGGGTLATLLIATLANTAAQGLMSGQLDTLLGKLDRLIASLDGGAAVRPDTNVITQLQAANQALE